MKRAKPPRSLALTCLVVFVGLLFLELLPATGPLLARAGAAYVAGWLVQVCLLATLVDAARGALPRLVAILPLLGYAGYGSAVWEQNRRVELRSEALQASNPGVVLAFDPDKHSLVTENAETFALSHAIPIVYSHDPDQPNGYISYRVDASLAAGSLQKVDQRADAGPRDSEGGLAGAPGGLVIEASVANHPGDLWKDWGIGEQIIKVSAKGARFEVFRSAYVDRLPPLPFITIGCTYAGGASRQCTAGFVTERLTVESRPKSVDRRLYDAGLSVMLKIAARTDKDRVRPYALKVAATPEFDRAENAEFAEFEALIKGGDNELSSTVAKAVANNSSRLDPLAPLLVSRFLDLYRTNPPKAPGRQRKLSLLAMTISALSPNAFSAAQDRLAPLLGELSAYPLLQLRMADLGVAAYSYYRDRIMGNDATEPELTASILAVCRLGFADDELISFLKSKLDSPTDAYAKPELISAIVVAMMKLGQEKIAREINISGPDWLQTWRSAVLSGEGRTDVGPNNCMPIEWPLDQEIPPVMAPGLIRVVGRWEPRPSPSSWLLGAHLDHQTFASVAHEATENSVQVRASLKQ